MQQHHEGGVQAGRNMPGASPVAVGLLVAGVRYRLPVTKVPATCTAAGRERNLMKRAKRRPDRPRTSGGLVEARHRP